MVAIVNASGTTVVDYTYDTWGALQSTTGSMATTLGTHNPLRYRGYVYDEETGLYYLQSRYYGPELGRFINADAYTSTGQGLLGNNMFAYCFCNPVNFADPIGKYPGGGYDDPLERIVPELIEAFYATDENETNSCGELSTTAKIKKTIISIGKNFYFSAGIGLGLCGTVISGDFFSVEAGAYADLAHITYSNGELIFGQYAYAGIEATVLFDSVGRSQESITQYPNFYGSWMDYELNDAIWEWGVGVYLYAGGNVTIGYHLNGLLYDISNIWGIG